MTKSRAHDEAYHHTLDDVAKELGVTRERVRQIQNKALDKLRARLQAEGYTPENIRELARLED